jgi:hypothetical protein
MKCDGRLLLLLLLGPTFASRGILFDPQGDEYGIDSPLAWWRFDDLLSSTILIILPPVPALSP